MDFSGKSIFITGASNGLGRTVAISFAKSKANTIILTGRNEKRLLAVADECKKFGSNVFTITGEMENKDDVERIAAFVEEKTNSKLDIFVGNHGSLGKSFQNGRNNNKFDINEFNKVMTINFESNVRFTNLLGRIMNKGGSIIFVTKMNSGVVSSYGAAFNSSKAALSMFMKCAALDLAERGVRVNSTGPGMMDTSFNNLFYDNQLIQKEELEKQGKRLPCRHKTSIQGVANSILFLASDLAVDINGTEQVVDCGHSLMLVES
ncbi:3-oxoacyl-[acyl-carrier-protein] reductase, chloroplastic-like protein [Tritrichomonas foetus]|uniref:3-oxoacyl-[acyl-carrier-protein] reductase, chloroplastic-like protein n=1 Tax=Tritrichomonas foetus TaxID=1144522 RepID=A0A1J4K9L6_9EUKA|nr:3-oxoacyl-[acyl-carrier-protein] reductase, chloroplastic-like protein [Tritrichomonas foetus]|eukprot:OHT08119.1 3-oxoacyl-[acyl-carrier-protein] reductase, chloroplastic-like protein [Tritrichomonas foetus]